MTREFKPNKMSEKPKRRACQIKDKLKRQGVRDDEAEKQAVRQARAEIPSGGESGQGES